MTDLPILRMTQSSVRAANLALVLNHIPGGDDSISRAEIAVRVGMTRSTVSRLVDDLIVGGLVHEGETTAGARGRPAVPLTLQGGTVISLGLEVNIERLVATVIDLTGEVLTTVQREVDTLTLPPGEVMAQLAELAGDALRQSPPAARLTGAVLALPGLVDRTGTRVLRAPNLGWEGVAPAEHWTLTHGGARVRLRCANDIDCSALTVLREEPKSSFIYVTGEVGIGAAIAIDGTLLTGRSGWAAELGHVCVDPQGETCGCGSVGCLETVVGARALLARNGYPDLDALVRDAEGGQEAALAVLDRVAVALGIALSAALNLLDVENIRLGGHLGRLEPLLRERLTAELNRRVLWAHHSGIEIEVIGHTPLRAAMGAGLSGLSRVFSDPAAWVDPLLTD